MGKGTVEGFIPDMATGTNADPSYSQRKSMFHGETKAEIQILVKKKLQLVLMLIKNLMKYLKKRIYLNTYSIL